MTGGGEVVDFQARLSARDEVNLADATRPGPPLQSGGGGGTFDGMEARVARLEADVEHIKTDIGDIKGSMGSLSTYMSDARVNIGVLTERVSHLPTKMYIGVVVSSGVAFVIAALTLLSHLGWLVAGPPTH